MVQGQAKAATWIKMNIDESLHADLRVSQQGSTALCGHNQGILSATVDITNDFL